MRAYRRIGVSAWRRGGVAAWRRGGVAAWRRLLPRRGTRWSDLTIKVTLLSQ
jgi:hypothetical protein